MINRRGFLGAAVAAPAVAPQLVEAAVTKVNMAPSFDYLYAHDKSLGPVEDPSYIEELRRLARGEGWFPNEHDCRRMSKWRTHYESLKSVSPAMKEWLSCEIENKWERQRRMQEAIDTLIRRGLSW